MRRLAVVVIILSVLTIPALAITITDSPPSLTLYTKTGLHVVKITATAKDDVEVKLLKVYVNDIPVLVAHKDKYKFTIKYKHELKDALREVTKWFETGEVSFKKGWRLRHRLTENHEKELSVKDYPIVLPPGDFLIKTVAMDNAGHVVTKTARVKIIRDYPPSIQVSTPSSVRTNSESAKVNVKVNAKDDLGLKSIELYLDNKLLRKIEVNKKSYSETVTLTVTGIGRHEIKAVATDTGNEKVHDVARIELIKNKPPTVKIKVENTRTKTDEANVKFTISYSDESSVTRLALYVDGVLIDEIKPYKATGSWIKTVTLPVGNHRVEVIATDDMGLQGKIAKTFSVVKEDNPPTVWITSPKNGYTILTVNKIARVKVAFYARDDVGIFSWSIFVDGRVPSYSCLGGFYSHYPREFSTSRVISLPEGTHKISVQVRDTSGHTAWDHVTILVKKAKTPHVTKITVPEIHWSSFLPKGKIVVIGG